MIIKCAKLVLARDPKIFVLVYIPLLAILSLIFDHVQVPQTIFSDANNLLNLYLFKPSFNYTCFGLSIFILVTLTSLRLRHLRNLLMPYTRLFVSWLLYTMVKQLVEVLAILYGKCKGHPELDNQQLACTLSGYSWLDFRVSGHAFYLLYAMLLILEEATAYDRWQSKLHTWKAVVYADNLIHNRGYTSLDPVATYHKKTLSKYQGKAPVVKIAYTLLAIWMLLLHLNMIFTIMYFHTAVQKIAGSLMAVALWLVTYGAIFKLDLGFDDDLDDEDQPFYMIPATSTSSLDSQERLLNANQNPRESYIDQHLYSGQKAIYKYSV